MASMLIVSYLEQQKQALLGEIGTIYSSFDSFRSGIALLIVSDLEQK
jgi:hypothetical protein